MKALTRRLTQLTIGIAALALTLTAATPALARGRAALSVQAIGASGRMITVNVANPTSRPLRGRVVARVLTTRGIVAVVASVDVAAGQTGTAKIDLPLTAVDVPPLGVVVDDGVPF
jgi:hypothetical protein